jgi:hypothetical protein
MKLKEFRKLETVLGHPPTQEEVRKAKAEKQKLLQTCKN